MSHRSPWIDLALRGGGLLLIACAAAAAAAFPDAASVAANGGARTVDFLLALIAFSCGTIGGAMLAMGAHLLDPVELGARWRRFVR